MQPARIDRIGTCRSERPPRATSCTPSRRCRTSRSRSFDREGVEDRPDDLERVAGCFQLAVGPRRAGGVRPVFDAEFAEARHLEHVLSVLCGGSMTYSSREFGEFLAIGARTRFETEVLCPIATGDCGQDATILPVAIFAIAGDADSLAEVPLGQD